jgi:hypothetical protein
VNAWKRKEGASPESPSLSFTVRPKDAQASQQEAPISQRAQATIRKPDPISSGRKAPKRSLPQNDRMWAMLTDLAAQVKWHGLRLTADDWKLIFLDALKREVRMVPNLDGNGFVSLGRSSSDLSKPR